VRLPVVWRRRRSRPVLVAVVAVVARVGSSSGGKRRRGVWGRQNQAVGKWQYGKNEAVGNCLDAEAQRFAESQRALSASSRAFVLAVFTFAALFFVCVVVQQWPDHGISGEEFVDSRRQDANTFKSSPLRLREPPRLGVRSSCRYVLSTSYQLPITGLAIAHS
jgi:hypothetical protein